MKVSKVVMIVVALHVLVIGGIFTFEGCSRSHVQAPDVAATDNQSTQQVADATSPTDPLAVPTNMTAAVPGATSTSSAPMATDATAVAPTTAPVAPATTAPATATYTVKKGDSLWKIAKAEGTTMGALMQANNLTKTSKLKIGQSLAIPAKAEASSTVAAATTAPAATAAAPEASGASYTVKSGDSLWKIANRNGVTVVALKQANNLSNDRLKIGQKLTIPAKAQAAAATTASATTHAVATGSVYNQWEEPGKNFVENGQTIHVIDFNESLSAVATKYGVSTKALMAANNITDARNIHPGQRLVIPTAAAPSADTGLTAPVVQTTASVR